MKILMIGGTGIISTAVSRLLLSLGHDLHLLTRGTRATDEFKQATLWIGDIEDELYISNLLNRHNFDVIINWIVFTPEQAERDIRLFSGKTDQYIFISSASAYQKPVKNYLITEKTPLENPFWDYSRNKIACENVFRQAQVKAGLPLTIIRPSLTFGDTQIPYVMNSWDKPWSLIERIRKGKKVIVPGDGTSLWTMTHNSDFAEGLIGLMGNRKAIGEDFHITSDEVLNWNIILNQIAEAAGLEVHPIHISSDFIVAHSPDQKGNLLGDKAESAVFDNSKIKSLVPEFNVATSFKEGISRTIKWFEKNPEFRKVDEDFDKQLDHIIKSYEG